MTAPEKASEIKGEKTTLYGYTVHIVKKVYLTVDEHGLHVRPVVYVVVAHPEDPKGYYMYKVEESDDPTYDWFIGLSVAEMYREIKDKVDALYTKVREKIAAFDAIKGLLEKEGVIVRATCWGYYKDKEDVIKELQ